MNIKRSGKIWIAVLTGLVITAAVSAAVFYDVIIPPAYSAPSDKTVKDGTKDITVSEKGRDLEVYCGDTKIWSAEGILVQDFLLADIDRDGSNELLVLCWKRGRYGKHRPTWVRSDEIRWSQHIFIYEMEGDKVFPKWMASDIGMKAASWEYKDGMLYITDTAETVTKWKWIHWGLEKM